MTTFILKGDINTYKAGEFKGSPWLSLNVRVNGELWKIKADSSVATKYQAQLDDWVENYQTVELTCKIKGSANYPAMVYVVDIQPID